MKYIGQKYKVRDNSYAINLTAEKTWVDLAPCEANGYSPSPILTITHEPFEMAVEFRKMQPLQFVIAKTDNEYSYLVLFDARDVM